MRTTVFLVLMCVFNHIGYTHEANEAFFEITQKDSTVEIIAEFPWSLRNALLLFDPSLQEATDRTAFEKTFVQYLQSNLVFFDKNGNELEFLSYQELDHSGHSHQNRYLIVYQGKEIEKVLNKIMFNAFDNQINYHTLNINSKRLTFETHKSEPFFSLQEKTYSRYLGVITILALLTYFLMRSRKRLMVSTNKD